ncbi:MAG TPA: amidohydrolase family protein [Candidatus Binatia bacterium]
MKKMHGLFTVALSLVLVFLPGPSSGQGTAIVAFEGVTLIPMDRERLLPKQTVIVRDGRIADIASADRLNVPSGAVRVDGRGKFLIPALAEMHAHIPGSDASDQEIARVLFMYVANGIGTIRGMLGDPRHLLLRDRAARGELISPTIYTSGPSFRGTSAPTVDVAVKMVTEQKAAGYDFLKIHPGVKRDVFDALAATADKLGIRFAGHVPVEVGLARALEARYWTIDHLDGYVEALAREGAPVSQNFGANLISHIDESRLPALIAQTKAAGTWMVPTQILLENWFGPDEPAAMAKRPEIRYADPKQVENWTARKKSFIDLYPIEQRTQFIGLRRRLIKALHDGGVGFLLGSDAPQVWNVPGFSMHRELGVLVASGLTPYQALATGTRNIAVYFGTLDRSGTIEKGKQADLVLLEANPLQDIANTSKIAGVIIGGRWLPKSEIERRLNDRS